MRGVAGAMPVCVVGAGALAGCVLLYLVEAERRSGEGRRVFPRPLLLIVSLIVSLAFLGLRGKGGMRRAMCC